MAVLCFLLASVAAVADALQQPTVMAQETDGAFRAVSSKMDELHAGLAKAKLDNLNVLTKQKEDFDLELEKLINRNRDTMRINTEIASDVRSIQADNSRLRKVAGELTKQCNEITSDLFAMQSNITLAQEFINRSINTSNFSLRSSPELNILVELDRKDAEKQHEISREESFSNLERLGGTRAAMMQVIVTEKNRTQELLEDLLSSFKDVSGQQNTSLQSLRAAYEKEQDDLERQHLVLLQEQRELNATKAENEALHVKLQVAIDHLQTTREHLDKQRLLLKKFATRLAATHIDGMAAPNPVSLDLPGNEVTSSPQEQTTETGVLSLSSWLKAWRSA